MTQTATPEQVSKIAAPGDRVIIVSGTFDGHMGTIESVSFVGACRVRLDVTDKISFYNRDELVYPTGERLETHDEQRDREARERTKRRLHQHARNLRPVMKGREAAIVMMAARYGAAERLKGSDAYDLDLTYRAATRRFEALQRLVYGD